MCRLTTAASDFTWCLLERKTLPVTSTQIEKKKFGILQILPGFLCQLGRLHLCGGLFVQEDLCGVWLMVLMTRIMN